MPPPVHGPSGRDPFFFDSWHDNWHDGWNDTSPASPIRRRDLRRQSRAYNLLSRASADEDGTAAAPRTVDTTPYRRVRSDSGAARGWGALRPSTGMLPLVHSRSAPRLPSVDLNDLPPSVLRAGQEALDCFAAHLSQSDTSRQAPSVAENDIDIDDEEEEQIVVPSFSRMVSARRAFAARHGVADSSFEAVWAAAPILEASDHALPVDMTSALSDILVGGLASEDETNATLRQMLDREAVNHAANRGSEMVESEMRRAMAECAYEALLKHCGGDVAAYPKAFDDLVAYVERAPDLQLRRAALRVIRERIDAPLPGGHERMYEGVSGLCRDVSLKSLAQLVWAAIQNAPADDERRAELRALLLYNLADCLTKSGFCCNNGVFQRLLAPLDGVYPGVRTLARTPYEVVQPVALAWRDAIARGERTDSPDHWRDFKTACVQVADAYFRDDTPLYPVLKQQLQRAICDCQRALAQEI